MTRPPTPCETNFRLAAPPLLFRDLLALLNRSYGKSYKYVKGKDFRDGAGNTLLPHHRRAIIESRLEALAAALGLPSRIVRFEGNTDDFVLIEMPGGVELIVCYVKDKNAPVRYARKREDLTRQSNMPYLEMLDFIPQSQNMVLAPSGLFSILTHCPDEQDPGRLGEANILFPSPDPHYSLGSLNLQQEAERVYAEDAAVALKGKRKVEVKLKKEGGKES